MTHPFRSYVICTSPRSGSTMLCKLLAATKVAGNPGSHFHKPSIDAWLDHYGLTASAGEPRRETLANIVRAATEHGKGDTDVFGLRLQRGSFAFFMKQLEFLYPTPATDVTRINAAFGPTLFIHLTRNDKLDQAISYIRAEQTGLWHRWADGADLERQQARRDDAYDPQAIKSQMDQFAQFDEQWRAWFDQHAIDPLRISYDALAAAPQTVLGDILSALGADRTIARAVPVQTAKLADETNRDWRRRFETERL